MTHIELELRDLGSLVGVLAEGVTDLDRLDLLGELFKEFFINFRLDEDATTSTATLAVVPAEPIAQSTSFDESRWQICSLDTVGSPIDGLVDIRVVEDDVRALPTKFKSDVLEIALGGSFHDLSAGDGRASEGDLLDKWVLADRLTDGASISDDQVEGTSREANLMDHLGHHESAQRSELGRLHDDSVPGGESRTDLPAQHQDYGGVGDAPFNYRRKFAKGTYEGSSKG